MMSDITVSANFSASSSGPVLPASYFVRDPEQIAASEALLVLHEGTKGPLSLSCWLTIPKTSQTPDVPRSAFRRFTRLRGHTM